MEQDLEPQRARIRLTIGELFANKTLMVDAGTKKILLAGADAVRLLTGEVKVADIGTLPSAVVVTDRRHPDFFLSVQRVGEIQDVSSEKALGHTEALLRILKYRDRHNRTSKDTVVGAEKSEFIAFFAKECEEGAEHHLDCVDEKRRGKNSRGRLQARPFGLQQNKESTR